MATKKTGKKVSPRVIWGLLVTVLVVIVAVLLLWQPMVELASDRERMKELVESAGIWGPLVFMGIQFLQVVFAPIPGQVAGVIAGALFGPWLGTLYSVIGAFLGFTLIFVLSRKLGRPFVERFVQKQHLKKFDYLTKKAGPMVFFLIFLLPGFPDDVICYIAGLSSIPLRTLIVISLAGRIPGYLITSFMGAGIGAADTKLVLAIVIPTIILGLLAFWKRKELEAWVRAQLKDDDASA
jgi:uncharacterized membrane protein YdjX (TVP38/TMEM64 family)